MGDQVISASTPLLRSSVPCRLFVTVTPAALNELKRRMRSFWSMRNSAIVVETRPFIRSVFSPTSYPSDVVGAAGPDGTPWNCSAAAFKTYDWLYEPYSITSGWTLYPTPICGVVFLLATFARLDAGVRELSLEPA